MMGGQDRERFMMRVVYVMAMVEGAWGVIKGQIRVHLKVGIYGLSHGTLSSTLIR